jgi:hypothetical protein
VARRRTPRQPLTGAVEHIESTLGRIEVRSHWVKNPLYPMVIFIPVSNIPALEEAIAIAKGELAEKQARKDAEKTKREARPKKAKAPTVQVGHRIIKTVTDTL